MIDNSVIETNFQKSIFFAFIISPHTLSFFMEENFVYLSNGLLFCRKMLSHNCVLIQIE